MLVLSRKKLESIVIGDDIEVFVVSIQDGNVRLGVKADGKTVHRREIYNAIRKEIPLGKPALRVCERIESAYDDPNSDPNKLRDALDQADN